MNKIEREKKLKELKEKELEIQNEISSIYDEISREKEEEERARIRKYMENPYYYGKLIVNSMIESKYYGGKDVFLKIWGISPDEKKALCVIVWENGVELKPLPLFSPKEYRKLMDEKFMKYWLIDELENISKETFQSEYRNQLKRLEEWVE